MSGRQGRNWRQSGSMAGPELPATNARGELEAQLRAIEPDVWADVARGALQIGSGDVTARHWEPVRSSLGVATAGIYRVRGTVAHVGVQREWSAILKVIRAPSGTRHDAQAREPGQWAYWRREALIYRSGLLAGLPGGLTAPRCLRLEERTAAGGDPTAWLWLEDLVDQYGGWWPVERTLLAAEHLGECGGVYLSRPPEESWLGRGYLRQRVVYCYLRTTRSGATSDCATSLRPAPGRGCAQSGPAAGTC